jgi:hypothetical protein
MLFRRFATFVWRPTGPLSTAPSDELLPDERSLRRVFLPGE